jgi:hypothetical protein
VEELRTQSQAILFGARKVFCLSEDGKFRMVRRFQLANLEVRGNLEPPVQQLDAADFAAGDQMIGVAAIGFISREKGMDILRDTARASLPM